MLVRMLSSMSKWDGSTKVSRRNPYIPADTISDLRTTGNTLSTWECTAADIEDAVVALALNRAKVQKLTVAFLKPEELQKIEIGHSGVVPGKAPGCDDPAILGKHRDLVELDYWRIGFLAEHILELVKDQNNYRTFSKAQVKSILEKYKTRLDISKMNESLVKDLGWEAKP